MISFTDIIESIQHIRNNNKKNAATEGISSILKKRDHYKDLSTSDLQEETSVLVSTWTLYKNNENSLFIGALTNPLKEDQEPKKVAN